MKNRIAYYVLNWIIEAMAALRNGPRPSETFTTGQFKAAFDCIMHDSRFYLNLLERDGEDRGLLLSGFVPQSNSIRSAQLNTATAQLIHLMTKALDEQETQDAGVVRIENPLGQPSQWLGGMHQNYDSLARVLQECTQQGTPATALNGAAWALNFAHARIQEMLNDRVETAQVKQVPNG